MKKEYPSSKTPQKQPLPKKVKRLFAGVLAVILISVLSFTAYAWLIQKDRSITNKTVITDFNIACDVYFVKGDASDNKIPLDELKDNQIYQKPDSNSMISVSFNKSDPNYIGNLRLVVKFNGGSPAYIRVKILEQWTVNDTFIASKLTPYTVPTSREEIFGKTKSDSWLRKLFPSWNEKNSLNDEAATWVDNRKNDYCFYYNAPLYPLESGKEIKLLLLNGITPAAFDTMMNTNDKTQLNLIIEAEAVQPNRYREFWGIDSLPWETKESPAS